MPKTCTSMNGCPGVHPMSTGEYMVIGKIPGLTDLEDELLEGAVIGPGESAVVVPAEALVKSLHLEPCDVKIEFTLNDKDDSITCTQPAGHPGRHRGPGGSWPNLFGDHRESGVPAWDASRPRGEEN